jgi:MerR family regulatory protein
MPDRSADPPLVAGSEKEAVEAVEVGCYFSVSCAEAIRPKVLEHLPEGRVLTETDFPHTRSTDTSCRTRCSFDQRDLRAGLDAHERVGASARLRSSALEGLRSWACTEQSTEPLTIADVAVRSGLSPHTLRYYERVGLLDPVARVHGGQRRCRPIAF